jgi:O-antigen ligase
VTSIPQERQSPDLLEIVFVLSAGLALLGLRIFGAFTAYDLAILGLAFLIVFGPVRIQWIPASLRVAGLLLLAAGLTSAFRSTVPIQAIYQVLQFAFVFFITLPVVFTLARSRRAIHGSLVMMMLGYLSVVVVAMLQSSQVAHRVLPFYNTENPNALGIPTILLLPFVIYFGLDQWRKGRRLPVLLLGGGAGYVMLWALNASASRGATFATAVSVTVFILFRDGLNLGRRVLLRAAVVIVGIGVLAAIIYGTNLFPSTLKARIEGTFSGAKVQHSVADDRVALDRAGLREFLSSPLIGTGFDNFRYVSQFYDDSATFHDPHNVWVQFLAQTGIVGAAAFLFIICRWFVFMIRTQSRLRDRSRRELLWAFIAALTGLMVHSMVAPLVLQRQYWLLYGLGISAALLGWQETSAESLRSSEPMPGTGLETVPR